MKKLLSIVLCACILISIAIMGSVTEVAAAGLGPAVDKETVVIATADETPSLTTHMHNAVAGDYLNNLTHAGLFAYNANNEVVPFLAESYEVEKDENGKETIWLIKLREGLKFSDGSDLTSEDVVTTLEFVQDFPEIISYTQAYKEVEAVDELTVKISTGDTPSAILPHDLAHHANFILPKELIDADHDFNADPVGAGPYKFDYWNKSEEIGLVYNEYFFGEEPAIKKIVWKIIPEGINRTIALQAGEVDYIIEFDSATVDSVENDDNVVVWNEPGVAHDWLGINMTKAPFDDINVRKAINAGINKEDVIEVAQNGFATIAGAQLPIGLNDGVTDEGYDSYDPEKAKEYLEAWGGDPTEITLDIICSNEEKRRGAEVIQANLAELGINCTITSMDLATYLSETAQLNHDSFIGGYSAASVQAWIVGVFHSDNLGGSNKTGLDNEEIDALIDEINQTVDLEKSEELVKELCIKLNELCPQAPLYQRNNLSAFKKGLEGVEISPNGGFFVYQWYWADEE